MLRSEEGSEGTSNTPNTLYFSSSAMVGDRKCVLFETVKDTIVEMDEVMNFGVSTGNVLDTFVDGSNPIFTLTVVDDDGMLGTIAIN